MEQLKQRILSEGIVLPGNILKVDSFLNHQIDPVLFYEMGAELAARFAGSQIDKVLTIEASGIAIALTTALRLGVPLLFARKKKSVLMTEDAYTAEVFSYTKKEHNTITVLKKFFQPGQSILIVDDFLANGDSALGLAKIVRDAGCEVIGIGIVIEKSFQSGAQKITAAGYRLESLARIRSLENSQIEFAEP